MPYFCALQQQTLNCSTLLPQIPASLRGRAHFCSTQLELEDQGCSIYILWPYFWLPVCVLCFSSLWLCFPHVHSSEYQLMFLYMVPGFEEGKIVVLNFREKNKTKGITILGFNLYPKAIIIKTVWYSHQSRDIDQWNRINSPEVSAYTYGQLICNKGGKNVQ